MSVVDPKSGALIDPETGEVLEESLPDLGPEWRGGLEGERSRAGAPLSERVHDRGVATFIRVEKWDASRRGRVRTLEALRLMKLHARLRVKVGGGLVLVLQRVNRICAVYNLPASVCEEAAYYARVLVKRYKSYTPPEKVVEKLAIAAVYVAASTRGIGLALSLDQLHAITRYVRLLHQSLGINVPLDKRVYYYMNRIAAELDISQEAVNFAWRLYRAVKQKIQGVNLRTVAAATMYIAAKLYGQSVTQATLSQIVEISEASIRNALKKMGVTVVYKCNGEILEVWWPGKDSFGIRQPDHVCQVYGIDCPKPTIEVKNSIIEVELCG